MRKKQRRPARNARGRRNGMGIRSTDAFAIEGVHLYWLNLKSREIWIHGVNMNNDTDYEGVEPGVDYMMATTVIKNLHFLRHQSAREPVIVHLHTCGGIFEEGMAIYDTIRSMPYPVVIISYTHARSMSSIILQAGDRRLLMPNSCFMFHYGGLAESGDAKRVISVVDWRKRQEKIMINIYIEKASAALKFKGWSEKRIRNIIESQMDKKGDVFLTAEEAIEWGFADEILTDWSTIKKGLSR